MSEAGSWITRVILVWGVFRVHPRCTYSAVCLFSAYHLFPNVPWSERLLTSRYSIVSICGFGCRFLQWPFSPPRIFSPPFSRLGQACLISKERFFRCLSSQLDSHVPKPKNNLLLKPFFGYDMRGEKCFSAFCCDSLRQYFMGFLFHLSLSWLSLSTKQQSKKEIPISEREKNSIPPF